jgi:hypothetical protein
MNDDFDLCAYLPKLAIIRKTLLSTFDLKEKLKISEYQIQQLENGNIHFMEYPYNYHITKQYIQLIDTYEISKIKADHFKKHIKNKIIHDDKKDDVLNSSKIKELILNFNNWIKK